MSRVHTYATRLEAPPAEQALSVPFRPGLGVASAAKTEPGKEAGSVACECTRATDDAARRRFAGARDQRIVLRPRIRIAEGPSQEQVQRLVHLAHEHCYIANSLRSEIVVEAVVA